jgi:hypothetical protein
MRRKNWLTAAILPASLLAFCSAANAAVVDCTMLTVTCNTFTKGSAGFKPVLATHPVGTCPTSIPANTELISIKGAVSDCTVSNPNVKIISGSVKGTIYTADCSCAGLAVSPNPIIVPPAGKFNQLATSWKFDTVNSTDTCMPGQKASTIGLVGGVAGITSGPFIASLANGNFNPTAVYGAFTLKAPGVGVAGIFQGADLGATTTTTASTIQSLAGIFGTCGGPKGLKSIAFAQADTNFK